MKERVPSVALKLPPVNVIPPVVVLMLVTPVNAPPRLTVPLVKVRPFVKATGAVVFHTYHSSPVIF